MVHARSVLVFILRDENVIVYILIVYVVIQAQPIDNYCIIQSYVVDFPLTKENQPLFFMILTISGKNECLGTDIGSENVKIIDTI